MNIYKAVVEKLLVKNFDYSRPDIDIFNFHPQLAIFLASSGIFFNKRKSIFRLIWPLLSMCTSIAGVGLQLVSFTHFVAVKDYAIATECFCYVVAIFASTLIMYVISLLNDDQIYSIIKRMNYDFIFFRNLESRYREKFLKRQLQIWQFCHVWIYFCLTVGVNYLMMPIVSLLYQSLFVTQDEHTIRPLVFPMWLPHDDPYRTPNYEVFLFMQSYIIICVTHAFGVYIYTLFHILLHYDIIMDMMILHFEVIFDGLDESVALLSRYDQRRMDTQEILNSRMANIVNMHSSVFQMIKSLSSVYGPIIVYQIMFSSVALCLMVFQIAEKLDEGSFHVLFFMLGSATVAQIWIPCYLGTLIKNKAFAVGDACLDCGWHLSSLGLLLRQDILMFVMRAQQPVSIKYTGLPNVTLETFSGLMSKAYSYFTMLRQYSKSDSL